MSSAIHGDFRALETLVSTLSDPALAALARATLAASRLDHAETRRELSRFARDGDRRTDDLALACGIATNDAFAAGDYGSAARSAQRWVDLLERSDPRSELEGAKQLRDLAQILASSPRQHSMTPIHGSARAVRDAVGLIRTDITLAGTQVSAVVDTGANVSVVSSSFARRLGLKVLSGTTSIGSATREALPTRVALAPSLTIAGVRLANVAFLVLDDAELAVPVPNYRIDAIVGFPVLVALRRIAFSPGRIDVGPLTARRGSAAQLRVVGNDLHVMTSVNGTAVPLHLDTGATASSLTSLFLREDPAIATVPGREVRFAGAGGSGVRSAAQLADARVSIAAVTVTLPSLDIVTGQSPYAKVQEYGVLGQDVLHQLRSYAVDFSSMTLQVD